MVYAPPQVTWAMSVARGVSPASKAAAVMVSECRSTARRATVSAVPRKRMAPGGFKEAQVLQKRGKGVEFMLFFWGCSSHL